MISTDILKKIAQKCIPLEDFAESISNQDFQLLTPKTQPVTYIDGGNAELISTNRFSLSLIKTAAVTYSKKRESSSVQEGILLVTADSNSYQAVFYSYGKQESFENISTTDENLTVKNTELTISSVPDIIRRLLELKHAILKDNIVCLDGSLQTKTDPEREILKGLDNVKLCSLVKSSQLRFSDGTLITQALKTLCPKGPWLYRLDDKDTRFHKAQLAVVLLHPKAEHAFILETRKDQLAIANTLAAHAYDPVFFGYPYGLIEADRLARVTNQEKEFYKTKISVLLKTLKSPHEVLDSISF